MREASDIIKYFDGKLTKDEIREEQAMLCMQLDAAGEEIKGAAQLVTRSVLRLENIRASGQFRFGYLTWDECLHSFIEERGIGSSSMKKWLKIVRVWKALGRDADSLAEYADGIKTIEPILDGRYKLLNEYNTTTGCPISLRKAWNDKLEGDTPEDKLNRFIDQVEPEMTRKMVSHSIMQEAPSHDVIKFERISLNGEQPLVVKWSVEEVDGAYSFGTLKMFDTSKMHKKAFAMLCKRMRL